MTLDLYKIDRYATDNVYIIGRVSIILLTQATQVRILL